MNNHVKDINLKPCTIPSKCNLVAVLLLWFFTFSFTGFTSASVKPADRNEMKSVAEGIALLIRKNYLFEKKADSIADRFLFWFKHENWPYTINPLVFASRMEKALFSQTNDLHFYIDVAISKSTQGAVQGSGWVGRDFNYGVAKLDWLPGKIGYMEYRFFNFTMIPGAKEAIDQVMNVFSRADAVIIDLRNNSGGDGEMARYFISYLIPGDSIPLLSWMNRRNDTTNTQSQYSFKSLSAAKINEKPIFILTSGGTGSSAEMFAFLCRKYRSALIVGESTAGGGHNMSVFPVGERFTIGIPSGRFYDPETGIGWEETNGVQPDIPIPAYSALRVAHELALDAIVEKSKDTNYRKKMAFLQKSIAGLYTNPGDLDESINEKEGTYGTIKIFAEGGNLIYQRAGRKSKILLVRTGENQYAFSSGEGPLVLFEKDTNGKYVTLVLVYEGTRREYKKI